MIEFSQSSQVKSRHDEALFGEEGRGDGIVQEYSTVK